MFIIKNWKLEIHPRAAFKMLIHKTTNLIKTIKHYRLNNQSRNTLKILFTFRLALKLVCAWAEIKL